MNNDIAFVVAVAQNGVIGRDGQLPWSISSDLKLFRKLTMGKPVVMGRATFDSIGKPLDGRTNIVISRDEGLAIDGALVVRSPADAIALARQHTDGEIMVIGGAQIYAALLDQAHRLYLTEVKLTPDGDAHFPPIDRTLWREVERVHHEAGPKDDADFDFVTLDRQGAS